MPILLLVQGEVLRFHSINFPASGKLYAPKKKSYGERFHSINFPASGKT